MLRGRHAPSARQLKQWASLARVLCERGWPGPSSIATAWHHIYAASEPSPEGRAAAQRAFGAHCSCLAAEDGGDAPPLGLSFSALATWPEVTSAADITADSQLATLAVDGAVLAHLLRQITAEEVARRGGGSPETAWGVSALPVPILKGYLQGGGCGAEALQLEPEALQAVVEDAVALLWWAAACFAQRATVTDWRLRLQWLAHSATLVSPLRPVHAYARDLFKLTFPQSAWLCRLLRVVLGAVNS